MSEQGKSTPEYPEPKLSPIVSFFRHIALLNVPPKWRVALQHLGIALFNWTMEVHGIASEQPDTERITDVRLNALASDLEVVAEILGSIGLEPGQSEMSEREMRMCRLGGELARPVYDVARRLRKVTVPPWPGEGS